MKIEIDVKFATDFQKEVYVEVIEQALYGIKFAMHGSHKKNEFNYSIIEEK